MKKYLPKIVIATLFSLLIIPQITLASWWNPLSWFEKTKPTEPIKEQDFSKLINQLQQEPLIETPVAIPKTPEKPTTFYVNTNNARVRKCASLSCEIVGYLALNDEIIVPASNGKTVDELADWQPLNFNGNGTEVFFHKSVISASPIKTVVSNLPLPQTIVGDPEIDLLNAQVENINRDIEKMQLENADHIIESHSKFTEKLRKEIAYIDEVIDNLKTRAQNELVTLKIKGSNLRKDRLEKLLGATEKYHEIILNVRKSILTIQTKEGWQKVNELLESFSDSIKNSYSALDKESANYDKSIGSLSVSISNEIDRPITPPPTPPKTEPPVDMETVGNQQGPVRTWRWPANTSMQQILDWEDQQIQRDANDAAGIPNPDESENFDPNNYKIVTTPGNNGGTMYKVVPPFGIRAPILGYYESEERAIESYKTWLSNNGY